MLIVVTVSGKVLATSWSPVDNNTFNQVFGLSGAAVFASMIAYLFAQLIDVRLFHFWKKLTKGRHLWLRNNASTIFSQCIDTFSVLFLLCYFGALPWDKLNVLFINGFLLNWLLRRFMILDRPCFDRLMFLPPNEWLDLFAASMDMS